MTEPAVAHVSTSGICHDCGRHAENREKCKACLRKVGDCCLFKHDMPCPTTVYQTCRAEPNGPLREMRRRRF